MCLGGDRVHVYMRVFVSYIIYSTNIFISCYVLI